MNNAILFFFNINIPEIKKINTNYYFTYMNNDYGVYYYNRDTLDAPVLYDLNLDMISKGLIGYEIIMTNGGEVLFVYEDKYYVLMKIPKIKNRLVTYDDVISFNFYYDDKKYLVLDKSNWGYNWSNKIDFISYQFEQMQNKFPVIYESIDYFIGIWENAISYYNDNVTFLGNKFVCHRRIYTNMDLLEFLNPLNFVIDYKERDVGEYIKSFVMNNNYSASVIDKFFEGFERNSIILLISRILFPSYYFDLYEDIILGETLENELDSILKKRNNVLILLNYVFDKFSNFNIPYIDWIKKEISLHQLI